MTTQDVSSSACLWTYRAQRQRKAVVWPLALSVSEGHGQPGLGDFCGIKCTQKGRTALRRRGLRSAPSSTVTRGGSAGSADLTQPRRAGCGSSIANSTIFVRRMEFRFYYQVFFFSLISWSPPLSKKTLHWAEVNGQGRPFKTVFIREGGWTQLYWNQRRELKCWGELTAGEVVVRLPVLVGWGSSKLVSTLPQRLGDKGPPPSLPSLILLRTLNLKFL